MSSRRRLLMTQKPFALGSKNGVVLDDWTTIGKVCAKGKAQKYYNIGDTKSVDLGEDGVINFRIHRFYADKKALEDGYAPITWIADNLTKGKYYHPTQKWRYSELRNNTINTKLYNQLPLDLRSVIVGVAKYTAELAIENTPDATNESLWIPGQLEFAANGIYESTLGTASLRQKSQIGSENRSEYWLRDRSSNYSPYFVDENGIQMSWGNSSTSNREKYPLLLGFCT